MSFVIPQGKNNRRLRKKAQEDIEEISDADLLENKYTIDEIFDIARGRKTDVTEEEVKTAQDVIERLGFFYF